MHNVILMTPCALCGHPEHMHNSLSATPCSAHDPDTNARCSCLGFLNTSTSEGHCTSCGHALVLHNPVGCNATLISGLCPCSAYTEPLHTQPQEGDRVVNAQGGSQHHIPVRFDLMVPEWLIATAQVLHTGAVEHGPDNWHNIPINDHLNHAMYHLTQYLANDRSEPHLVHATCRMMFAFWCEKFDYGNDQPTDDVNNPISMEY